MPNAKQIDAILPYLDLSNAQGFTPGTWSGEPGFIPSFSASREVVDFLDVLYSQGWITESFNCPAWQENAAVYLADPELVAAADARTIQKLLITHVRQDRFCEGHLAAVIESGHIVGLLRRLKEIRASLTN